MTITKQDDQLYYLRRLLTVFIGIFFIALIYLFSFARDFLVPVTLAILIAITFRPMVRWLAMRGVPSWATATAIAAAILVGGISAGYLISGPVSGWIANAPEIRRTISEKVRGISETFEGIAKAAEDVNSAASSASEQPVTEVFVKESGFPAFLWYAAYPASYVATFAGAVIFSLFFMASGDLLYEKLINVMPTLTDKKNALRVAQDVEKEVSAYLLVHSAINAGVGIAIAIVFYFMGMPLAYLWAFLAFVLNFIPYLGPIAGATISAVVGLVVFDSLSYALIAPALYTAVVTIENQVFSPLILGKRLQLNLVAILMSIAFWGWIWGLAGIVLAVPLLVTLKVFSSHFGSLAGVGEFLSEADDSKVADSAVPSKEAGRE